MKVRSSNRVTVDTSGAGFDTILAVYTGSAVGSLTRVACNDDVAFGDRGSLVQFTAVPGTTYRTQVGGYNGVSGTFPLYITRAPAGTLCQGQLATRVGTAGAETIYGTDGPDVIAALGGNDTIHGYGGDGVICAGPGADLVIGGTGADRLYGQGGADSLPGEAGNDRLFGGPGDDSLFGQTGTDRLRGGTGTDTCQTGEDVVC